MKSQKPQVLKTLDQLRAALRELIDESEDVSCEACKHVCTTHKLGSRSVSVSYSGAIYWFLSEKRGGILGVHQAAKTIPEVYNRCRIALMHELEERGRARRIEAERSARPRLTPPPPKCLEYQP